jgi:hypothetical protein
MKKLCNRILIAALVVGVSSTSCIPGQEAQRADPRQYLLDMVDWVGPARSLEAAVAGSEVIVRGRFVRPNEPEVIYPDGWDEDCCSEFEGGPGLSFTPVAFRAEEYIKGSGPEELLVLQPGDLRRSRGYAFFPEPEYGEETILFASTWNERANTWDTHHGIWGRVVIRDGAAVLPQDPAEQRPSPYFTGVSSLDEVELAIRQAIVD